MKTLERQSGASLRLKIMIIMTMTIIIMIMINREIIMPLIMMMRSDNENVGKAERRLIKARVSRGTEHRAVIVLNIRYLLRLNTLRMRMNLLVMLVIFKKKKVFKA